MVSTNKISLNGSWEYVLDPESKFTYQEVINSFNKTDKISVPSNWQLQGLNNFNGSVWYKFDFDYVDRILKPCLVFDGVDYFADVWLNNVSLGKHEGYFQKFYFEVGQTIKTSNVLVVKVSSPLEEPGTVWPNNKRLIKGIFSHHDCRPGGSSLKHGQDKNTGGIWNNVYLEENSLLRIKEIKIDTISVENGSAKLRLSNIHKEIYNDLEIKILEKDGSLIDFSISKDNNGLISVQLFSPKLWNLYEHGEPYLYTIKISLHTISYSFKYGIRKAELLDDSTFLFNGEKLFLRGTNIIPEQFLSSLSDERIRAIIELLKEANINIVMVHAHINRKEFYEEFDKAGILIWQDFPLQWMYENSPDFNFQALEQISDMIDQFYNYCSIVFWCCHNEPGDQRGDLDDKLFAKAKVLDPFRITRKNSNYEEHTYDGWYWGSYRDYIAAPRGPLVTEFGAQAIPNIESLEKFIPKEKLYPPDIEFWEYHNLQFDQTFNIANVSLGNNIEELIDCSQRYQSVLLKTAIENYRRAASKNIRGVFQFMFIDCWPSITWSVVDYYLKPKQGFYTLKKYFNPLLLSVNLRQVNYYTNTKLNSEIWLINNSNKVYSNLKIEILLDEEIIKEIIYENIKVNETKFLSFEQLDIQLEKTCENSTLNYNLKDNAGKILFTEKFMISVREKSINTIQRGAR